MFEFASVYNKLVRSVQFCDIWNTFYHLRNSKSWNVQVHSVHRLVDDEGHRSTVSIVVASCTPCCWLHSSIHFQYDMGNLSHLAARGTHRICVALKRQHAGFFYHLTPRNGAMWGCWFPPKMVPNSNAALSVQSGTRPDFLYSLPYEDTKGCLFCSSNIQYEHTI